MYASAKPASPANDMDRPVVPKTDVALTSAIIFTSSVLSDAIMLPIYFRSENMPAQTGTIQLRTIRCKP